MQNSLSVQNDDVTTLADDDIIQPRAPALGDDDIILTDDVTRLPDDATSLARDPLSLMTSPVTRMTQQLSMMMSLSIFSLARRP